MPFFVVRPTVRFLVVSAALLLLCVAGSDAFADTAAQAASTGRLDIAIDGPDGAAVLRPYVAVVLETMPWAEPTREAVLEKGSSVRWNLPAGRYRVVAGAPGYAVEYGPTIEVPAGGLRSERVILRPLVPASGRLSDSTGAPIIDGMALHLRQMIHGFRRELSPTGERHLRGSFEAATDADGRFTIGLHPEAGQFLAVVAPGHAARFLPNVRAHEAEAILGDILLLPGASFTARWKDEPRLPSDYDRLQIVPADGRFPPGLDLAGVLAVWSRPLTGGSPIWQSLPAGSYEVWLKAPPFGSHRLAPLRLTTVTLEVGQREEGVLEWPASVPEVTRRERDTQERRRRVSLLVPSLSAEEAETLQVAAWDGGTWSKREWDAEPVSGGLMVRVPDACRTGGHLRLLTSERVGATGPMRARLCSAGSEGTLRAQLFRRAELNLSVRPPEGHELPEEGTLAMEPCERRRRVPGAAPLVMPVELGERGAVETPAPAGCFDTRLSVGDFAPLVLGQQNLQPHAEADLGRHRLRLGGAILARVVSPRDGRPLSGVAVAAETLPAAQEILDYAVLEARSTHAAADPLSSHSLAHGAGSATTGDDGWARLYGLPVGQPLTLLLSGPGQRLPHAAAEITLGPREELVVDAVELPEPATLTLQVTLSPNLEEEGVRPYQVTLQRLQRRRDDLRVQLSGSVDAAGRLRFPELPAGTWRATGVARISDGKPFPAGSVDLTLAAGEDRTVKLALDDAIYRGEVTYQGVAVEGSISFRPVSPPDRRGMTVRLDSEGEFSIPLEGPGTYRVEVSDRDGRFGRAAIPEVRFAAPEDRVEIRLPEGILAGRVIDESGRGVAGARVELASLQSAADGARYSRSERVATTGPAGRFTFEALGPGRWTLTAREADRRAAPRTVELLAHERVEGLEVEISPGDEVAGVVLDATGAPVAGAHLTITPAPLEIHEAVEWSRARTDAAGRFSIHTPYGGRAGNVQVVAPDGTATAIRLEELTADLALRLPASGAPVEIETSCEGGTAGGVLVLIETSGAFLSVPGAGEPQVVPGPPCRTTFTIPRLASGSWRLSRITRVEEEVLLTLGTGGALPALRRFTSAPEATVRLVADDLGSEPEGD